MPKFIYIFLQKEIKEYKFLKKLVIVDMCRHVLDKGCFKQDVALLWKK